MSATVGTQPAQYQDVWIKGRAVSRGQRECAKRYEIVRAFCARYQRPFTVLDVGAAEGYFAVRLSEDFPECTVVAVEPRPRIGEVLRVNGAERVIWLERKLSAVDIDALADVEHFDVTLALSMIHWLPGDPADTIASLRRLGDHLVAELPVEENATGQQVPGDIVPDDAAVLGYGESHLEAGARRPIYLLSQEKSGLAKSYHGSPHAAAVRVESTFEAKTCIKGKKVQYPWLRGINLQTFLSFGGAYPDSEHVVRRVREAYGRLEGAHGDVEPWNVIFQGDGAAFIDAKPKGERSEADAVYLERLAELITGAA